jgi:prophage tail gpP-like protein
MQRRKPAIYGSKLVYSQVYADWLANRRMGYAQPVEVVIPGWLDGNGQLWTPNQIVNVLLPHQNIGFLTAPLKMLVVGCRYSLSVAGGTTITLTLMPAEAFDVKPVSIPLNRDIQQLTQQGNNASKNP